MTDKIERLRKIGQLLDAGRITQSEHDALKAEILANPKPGLVTDSSEIEPPTAPLKRVTEHIPTLYKGALAAGIASLLLGGFFGLVAWATVLLAVVALVKSKGTRGRWMPWAGLALGIVFSLANAYTNGHLDSLLTTDAPSAQALPTNVEAPSTTALAATTTTARNFTPSYPEHLIVADLQEWWGNNMPLDPPPAATWLSLLRRICPAIAIDESAGSTNPAASAYLASVESGGGDNFVVWWFAEVYEAATFYYCPEYQEQWVAYASSAGEALRP